jgi:putative flippase GtrA
MPGPRPGSTRDGPVQSAVVPGGALRERLRTTWRVLLKELSAFGVVGAVCFAIDVGLFQYLYGHAGVDAVNAKLLSTVASTTLAFVGHRYWSFSHRARTGVRREYTLFIVVNGLALALGLAIIAVVRYPLGQESALVLQVANLVSIGLGTVLRYFCYRRWVFPAHGSPAAVQAATRREAGSSSAA